MSISLICIAALSIARYRERQVKWYSQISCLCVCVCLWLCPQSWSCSTHHSFDPIVLKLHIHFGCGVLIVQYYFQKFRSKVKVVGHRKVKNVFTVAHISETNSRRDLCQNIGEININNFCIWHFGLWPIVSKIARGQSSDPLLKMRRIVF